MKRSLLIAIAVLACTTYNTAQTLYTWTGGGNIGSPYWDDENNWGGSGFPQNGDAVLIPNIGNTGFETYPELPYDIELSALKIEPGARLSIGVSPVSGISSVIQIVPSATPPFGIENGLVRIDGAIIVHPFKLIFNGSNCYINNSIFASYYAGFQPGGVPSGNANDTTYIRFEGTGGFVEGNNQFYNTAYFTGANDKPMYISFFGNEGGISFSGNSVYHHHLKVERIIAASNNSIFNNGGVVNGNFEYINTLGGNTSIGNLNNMTSVSGMINVHYQCPEWNNNQINIFGITNNTTGGQLHLGGHYKLDMQQDTLKMAALNISGITNNFHFEYNKLEGNIALSDNPLTSQPFLFRSNEITGDAIFNKKGGDIFEEGGNVFNGNTNINSDTTTTVRLSTPATQYNGDLYVTRNKPGETFMFFNGGQTTGNFNYHNTVGGFTSIGSSASQTLINGSIDIDADLYFSRFDMYHLKNLSQGSIRVNNVNVINIIADTLQVDSFNITNLITQSYAYNTQAFFEQNNIAGNVHISSWNNDNAYNSGTLYIEGNKVIGSSLFASLGGKTQFYFDQDNINKGNHFLGDLTLIRDTFYNDNNTLLIALPVIFGMNDTEYVSGNFKCKGNISLGGKIVFNGADNSLIQSDQNPFIMPGFSIAKQDDGVMTLAQTLQINNAIHFISGIIKSSVEHVLIFNEDAEAIGVNSESYVNGTVTHIGDGGFTFPLGSSSGLRSVTIIGAEADDHFTISYEAENPDDAGYDTAETDAAIQTLLGNGYWHIDHTAGNTPVMITLHYDFQDGMVTDPSSLVVAHWNGAQWENLGNGSTTGDMLSGSITTAALVTDFSPFTIGTTDAAANPLPLALILFTATKEENIVSLKWQTVNEENVEGIVIERSTDAKNFIAIGQAKAYNNKAQNEYFFKDNNPAFGIDNYYRLKIVNADGSSVYSKIVKAIFNNDIQIILSPNPVNDVLYISGIEEYTYLQLIDVAGKVIRKQCINGNTASIPLHDIIPGTYSIQFINATKAQLARFVKQ